MDNLIHRFSVIKKCSSDYDCKIHEALLIKKNSTIGREDSTIGRENSTIGREDSTIGRETL